MRCHNPDWIEFVRNICFFAILIGVIFYNAAKKYEQSWGISDGESKPRVKTIALLYVAWYTPFVFFFYTSACESVFSAILAFVGSPIWIYVWIRWFFHYSPKQ